MLALSMDLILCNRVRAHQRAVVFSEFCSYLDPEGTYLLRNGVWGYPLRKGGRETGI